MSSGDRTGDSAAAESTSSERRAFRVAYDGRDYAGFQRQPHAETVEGTLLAALADLDVVDRGSGPTHATPPGYAAAGRTDAGVSALAQTVAFDAPDWLTPRAFNSRLPEAIRAWASADVPADFHATHHALDRTYRYFLYAPEEMPGRTPAETATRGSAIDPERLRAALTRLSGRHDFANLTPDDRGTVREVRAEATRNGDFLIVEVRAGGFPRALVRRLVAAARLVATGRANLAFLDRVLDPEPLPGHRGIGPAPAEPLVLWNVTYPGVRFRVDERAGVQARDVFDERHRRALRAAAVTEAISGAIGRVGPEGTDTP